MEPLGHSSPGLLLAKLNPFFPLSTLDMRVLGCLLVWTFLFIILKYDLFISINYDLHYSNDPEAGPN